MIRYVYDKKPQEIVFKFLFSRLYLQSKFRRIMHTVLKMQSIVREAKKKVGYRLNYIKELFKIEKDNLFKIYNRKRVS
jgi:hypothetical protein